MFKEERAQGTLTWRDLGDIETGRANLGPDVPVFVYRLLQYTFRDVMISELGVEKTNEIFVKTGKRAGSQFCANLLNGNLDFNEFVAELQRVMREQHTGILRIEQVDMAAMRLTVAVAEDLDCSGLPFSDEVVCQYDEGFLAGIFETYTGRRFTAKEVDCWASGDRVCRFDVREVKSEP